jgi:hypothetical protein
VVAVVPVFDAVVVLSLFQLKNRSVAAIAKAAMPKGRPQPVPVSRTGARSLGRFKLSRLSSIESSNVFIVALQRLTLSLVRRNLGSLRENRRELS